MAALQQSGRFGRSGFGRSEKRTLFSAFAWARDSCSTTARRATHRAAAGLPARWKRFAARSARWRAATSSKYRISAGTRCTKRRRILCFEGIAQDTRFYFVHGSLFAPRPRPKLCWAAANIRMNSPAWWARIMCLPRNFAPKKATMAACCFCVIFCAGTAKFCKIHLLYVFQAGLCDCAAI